MAGVCAAAAADQNTRTKETPRAVLNLTWRSAGAFLSRFALGRHPGVLHAGEYGSTRPDEFLQVFDE